MKTSPSLVAPLGAAIVLIVYGRVRRRSRWGNWIAVAGYAPLGATILIAVATRS